MKDSNPKPKTAPQSDRSPRIGLGGFAARFALVLILFLTFYPLIFMLMSSFKSVFQFYHSFWLPDWPLHLDNYAEALEMTWMYIWNSVVITAVSIGGIVACSVIGGFFFARYDFPGKSILYYTYLAMMMLPAVLMLIPSFMWVRDLGLLDTYWVMILPYIAGGQVLGIFLLRGFFAQIDKALFEAAEVDGAGPLRQLWSVALPLSKPVVGTIAIVSALGVWNNFLWPFVTTRSEDVMVLTVGLLRFNAQAGEYGKMFAGYTISAIPLGILFAICTRAFMRGVSQGALKG